GDTFRTLLSVGVGINVKTGELEIDDAKFNKILAEKPGDIGKLMMGDNGLGKSVDKAINEFVKKEGYFDTANEGINDTIKELKKQYEATALRIDAKMEGYRQRFLALDKMVVQMQGVSSYLTQQLSMLGNTGKK
ncbi:MAG TPA: flagellar filament capping protein FliD, partial [Alcaligenes sp.]|nr:flagellar filament capping protein FliD [Alcaligenes sp.]HRL25960.1 flagellar filament capping protein FliD [Alcaligenes sp.]